MTDREYFEIKEMREEIFREHDYICAVCGESIYRYGTPQLAHRIAQTKSNINKYGKKVIHNKLNLLPVCCLECNDACNIGYDTEATNKLVEEINKSLTSKVKTDIIECR